MGATNQGSLIRRLEALLPHESRTTLGSAHFVLFYAGPSCPPACAPRVRAGALSTAESHPEMPKCLSGDVGEASWLPFTVSLLVHLRPLGHLPFKLPACTPPAWFSTEPPQPAPQP